MCICYKFSAKYNRWWTSFFHVHCCACFVCLISLLFFGRLVFDDLDKRQFIHLIIHLAIVLCLLVVLTGNRCSLPRLYYVYFVGYHLFFIVNVGLELFAYYTTPHYASKSLSDVQLSSNETASSKTTVTPLLNVTRYPNGQSSPYVNMQEEALYALVLVCLIVQAYLTLVIYWSYRYLVDKKVKVHALESVVVSSKQSAATSDQLDPSVSSAPQARVDPAPPVAEPKNKWQKRFETVGSVVAFIAKVLPQK